MGAIKNFIEEAFELYQQGYSVEYIADKFGCSKYYVISAINTYYNFNMKGSRETQALLFLTVRGEL